MGWGEEVPGENRKLATITSIPLPKIDSYCSFGLSATSQQYFSLKTNQPPATSQQYFSLTANQHQPSATSETNRLYIYLQNKQLK
jgi:hypothetical protein